MTPNRSTKYLAYQGEWGVGVEFAQKSVMISRMTPLFGTRGCRSTPSKAVVGHAGLSPYRQTYDDGEQFDGRDPSTDASPRA